MSSDMDEIVGHLREKVVLPEADEIEIYPRRKPTCTREQGYKPFTPDKDLVPNVADFGTGYHIHGQSIGLPCHLGQPLVELLGNSFPSGHQHLRDIRFHIAVQLMDIGKGQESQ